MLMFVSFLGRKKGISSKRMHIIIDSKYEKIDLNKGMI